MKFYYPQNIIIFLTVAFNTARGHSMDSEHYITNIHAYWKHSQKESTDNAASSLPSKSQQSATFHSNSIKFTTLKPRDTCDQYLDHVDRQSDDDVEKTPRYKGNRESQDQWYDRQEKSPRRKKKNKDQLDDVDWDYYEDDNFSDYDHNFSD